MQFCKNKNGSIDYLHPCFVHREVQASSAA
jgi:hypothetical protein